MVLDQLGVLHGWLPQSESGRAVSVLFPRLSSQSITPGMPDP